MNLELTDLVGLDVQQALEPSCLSLLSSEITGACPVLAFSPFPNHSQGSFYMPVSQAFFHVSHAPIHMFEGSSVKRPWLFSLLRSQSTFASGRLFSLLSASYSFPVNS